MVGINRSEQLFGKDGQKQEGKEVHPFFKLLEDLKNNLDGSSAFEDMAEKSKVSSFLEELTNQIKANEILTKKSMTFIACEVDRLEGNCSFKTSVLVSVSSSVLFNILGGLSDLGMPNEVRGKVIDTLIEQLIKIKRGG